MGKKEPRKRKGGRGETAALAYLSGFGPWSGVFIGVQEVRAWYCHLASLVYIECLLSKYVPSRPSYPVEDQKKNQAASVSKTAPSIVLARPALFPLLCTSVNPLLVRLRWWCID